MDINDETVDLIILGIRYLLDNPTYMLGYMLTLAAIVALLWAVNVHLTAHDNDMWSAHQDRTDTNKWSSCVARNQSPLIHADYARIERHIMANRAYAEAHQLKSSGGDTPIK